MRETPPQGTLTPDDFRRIRDVFESALQRSSGERRAFVEEACGGNTLLVGEVERMLAADARADRLLDARDEAPRGRGPIECSSCRVPLDPASLLSDVRNTHARQRHPTSDAFVPERSSQIASASSRGSAAAAWARSIAPTTSRSVRRSR